MSPFQNLQRQETGSAISIAPIEESEPIQDELGLEGVNGTPGDDLDELMETEMTSNLPDQHGDEVFGDIFTPESKDSHGSQVDFDIDESSLPADRTQPLERLKLPFILLLLVAAIVCAVLFAPGFTGYLQPPGRSGTNPRDTGPSKEEIQLKERLAVAEMDPESRFATQIGETPKYHRVRKLPAGTRPTSRNTETMPRSLHRMIIMSSRNGITIRRHCLPISTGISTHSKVRSRKCGSSQISMLAAQTSNPTSANLQKTSNPPPPGPP